MSAEPDPRRSVEALKAFLGQTLANRPGPLPIDDDTPRDGSLVWLLVDHGDIHAGNVRDQGFPLVDARGAVWTLGFNERDAEAAADANRAEMDVWRFVGFDWKAGRMTEATGDPLAWKPIGFALNDVTAGPPVMIPPGLVDQFAAAALTGLVETRGAESNPERLASDAYRIARAMVKARMEPSR